MEERTKGSQSTKEGPAIRRIVQGQLFLESAPHHLFDDTSLISGFYREFLPKIELWYEDIVL
jgi:hypothetical protein